MKFVCVALLASLFAASSASAATVAIIDSGVDTMHKDLSNKIWVNKGEIRRNGVDDDNNGYIDDMNGWNFAENNAQVIDYSYLNTFSADCYKFFDIQKKILEGTATDEEKKWEKEKIADQNFVAELQKFGNFVHGTHVAGISARDEAATRLMAIKLIPTEVKLPGQSVSLFRTMGLDGVSDMLIKWGLSQLASQQSELLVKIGDYVKNGRASVANCSFGTSMQAAKTIVTAALQLLGQEPSEEDVATYSKFLVEQMVEGSSKMMKASPGTLFVIAAGNDGTNNDEQPVSPANVKANNTISVAATLHGEKLASFSNYGSKMVEVAAPGVGIESSIPGNEYLALSGTSQATPYVANVANRILSVNSQLDVIDVKKVIMETVDIKDYLAGKVSTSGLVNPERAIKAAELSRQMPLADAIAKARNLVADQSNMFMEMNQDDSDLFVLPLPSTVR